jgi:hypothetical protein
MATLEEIQQDHLIMSVAQALAFANDAAHEAGVDPAESLVTIAEETSATGPLCEIIH